MKKVLFCIALGFVFTSCSDIGSFMLYGGDGDYIFTNADLDPEYHVDEDKLHLFTAPSDDDTIYGLFLGDFSQIESDTIIVYLHGNAPSMDGFWSTVAVMANLGGKHRYGVVMYDYRGFGKSTGTSRNEETMAADYDAIMLWLEDRGLESDRMVVFANSLGSLPAGPAAAGGSRIPIEKLVLEVPQSSANVIMQNSTGLSLPSSMITEYNFDIGKNMEDYTEQLLWMHGALDDVAPLETAMGAVQRHNGSYYREEVYQDAGHGLRWDIGTEEWSRVLHEFILH
ncbi:alpha/beta hydrolase [Schleiferiaceae bacterium]|jgi:pimeloyl-ACP methyl ester carboxylesterase|nr:alpha/beta hydrolase [Schleiferiaceae bacterium]MDA8819744.1 alpha/beta hydrolase [Schleiferiaceae bacterium]